ncbi:MAG: riboflavin biosynthesis protein RibF [Candidatus Gastranaerophilales bacterium]|nr:riboflavin biosynthesis protein RibF [Candidatus Gastranaerophilales bacterium]
MEIITGTDNFYLEKETAVAMGKFDGVHIGHRRLLEEILGQREKGLAACVFTFEPSPAVLFGLGDGRVLTTREEKRLLFERMGVDVLIEYPLSDRTAGMSPEDFVTNVLAGQVNARFVAAGTDLSFGAKGRGDAALLTQMADSFDWEVKIIKKICLDGQEVSSSLVRGRLEQGDMALVERLLGMPYPIVGTVIAGNRIGRTLGFPTINLLPAPNKLLPPNGVYLSDAVCRGRRYQALSNIGCKPTVSEEMAVGVESYLYDFSEEVYGEQVEVYLRAFRRPEKKFDSLEALKEQLAQDIRQAF